MLWLHWSRKLRKPEADQYFNSTTSETSGVVTSLPDVRCLKLAGRSVWQSHQEWRETVKLLSSPKARVLAVAVASALLLTACSGTGSESTPDDSTPERIVLQFNTYAGSQTDQATTAARWAERVSEITDGGLTFELHTGGSLVGAEESVTAVRDGRVDAAHLVSFYAASELPVLSVAELPFESQNMEAQMIAMQRLYVESEAYRANFDDVGIVPLFSLPLGPAVLGTNKEVRSIDDLRGLNIRAGGVLGEVVLAAGANPVAMSANDLFEAMERGVIDGYTSFALASLTNFGVTENTPFVANAGFGTYTAAIVGINKDVYESLPESYQDAILAAAAEAVQIGIEEYEPNAIAACQEVRDAGGQFSQWDDSAIAELRDQLTLADSWAERMNSLGYDGTSILEDFRRIIADETAKSTYTGILASCIAEGS